MIATVDMNLSRGQVYINVGIPAARIQELLEGKKQVAESEDGSVVVRLCECDDQEPSPVILRVIEEASIINQPKEDNPCGCS